MARFDVYRNVGQQQKTTPYLVDVQSNYLHGLVSRVVVPLRLRASFPQVRLPEDLTPVFIIEGQECFLDAPKMAAIPSKELGNQPVQSLTQHQDAICNALDRLFGAY